jgi:hypothetical protein
MKKGIAITLLIALLTLPTILAYSFGYYGGPMQYLENEWTMFTIVFLLFFAVIYFTVNKGFKNNIVSGVIALSLSLLITMTILRRGLLYGYAGDELGSWMMVVVALVGFGFLIKFAYEAFGAIGSTGAVIIVWMLLQRTDPYYLLPYGVSDTIYSSYTFLSSFFGLVIMVALALALAPFMKGKSSLQRMFEKGLKKFGIN